MSSPLKYCYVRIKGGVLRTSTVKVFYTDETRMEEFMRCVEDHGVVKCIDFPERCVSPSTVELSMARCERRVCA